MNNWQQLFTADILAQSQPLAVTDLISRPTAITVTVQQYPVTITITAEKIQHMTCTCSIAATGKNCPRMAAVLLAYDQQVAALTKLVAVADESLVQRFLAQQLVGNEPLIQAFRQALKPTKRTTANLPHYTKQLDQVMADYFEAAMVYDDWYDEDYPTPAVYEFLTKAVNDLSALGDGAAALELVTQFVEQVTTSTEDEELIDMLTDDGGFTAVLQALFAAAPVATKQKGFAWIQQQVLAAPTDYFVTDFYQCLRDYFTEEEFLVAELALANQVLNTDDPLFNEDQAGNWLALSLQLMRRLKQSPTELATFADEHWAYSAVQSQYADILIAAKDYPAAIKALNASVKLERNWPKGIKAQRRRLATIYQTLQQPDKYRHQLHLMLTGAGVDMTIIAELKASCTAEQWQQEREKLFHALSNSFDVDQFYFSEQRYDLLTQYVLKATGLDVAEKYLAVLKQDHGQELLPKYTKFIRERSATASNREQYQNLATYLHSMATMPNSAAPAQSLRAELLAKYPRRYTMREEFNRVVLSEE